MTTRTAYNPREDPVLRDFLAATREAVGKDPVEVLLFGSRARGDYDPTSDYDLIMIYENMSPDAEEAVRQQRVAALVDKGAVISTFLIAARELERMRREPYVINAFREGVRLA